MSLFLFILYLCTSYVSGQSFAADPKVDAKELRCLVCDKSINELSKVISNLDPNKKVDVGGHRLDIDGNYKQKTIPQAQSEIFLSEILENVCEKMDNYIRAKSKSDGSLTLLSMMSDDGQMNPNWGDVDIIQDDDLNKSLKYYCEEIMGEYEEAIIRFYQQGAENISKKFCVEESRICPVGKVNEEL